MDIKWYREIKKVSHEMKLLERDKYSDTKFTLCAKPMISILDEKLVRYILNIYIDIYRQIPKQIDLR